MPFPSLFFRASGLAFMGIPPSNEEYYNEGFTPLQLRTWRAHFGACPRTSLEMWNLLLQEFVHELPRGVDLEAFFMVLFFLKTYPSVDVLASRVQKDQKTVRKWVWWYIEKMSHLSHILVSLNEYFTALQK